jgi:hypothetical protein
MIREALANIGLLAAIAFVFTGLFQFCINVNVDLVENVNAATIKDLGCYESVMFNDACTDELYSYCDSNGDGYYDTYYHLGKGQGLSLYPVVLDMDAEEAMIFYRKVTECKTTE